MTIFQACLSLIILLCVLASAAPERSTVYHGSSAITYSEPIYHGERFDRLAMPVGGWQTLMSRLYFPSYLRVQPAIPGGRTMVLVTINANGTVAAVSFSPPIHQGLEAVVVKAVYGTQWIPATKHNVPVRCRFRMPINFKIYKYN
jgi:TonB family protein